MNNYIQNEFEDIVTSITYKDYKHDYPDFEDISELLPSEYDDFTR